MHVRAHIILKTFKMVFWDNFEKQFAGHFRGNFRGNSSTISETTLREFQTISGAIS